ncbi:MAG: hypothetical protein Q9224_007718, partial [Gallowayella concinna]
MVTFSIPTRHYNTNLLLSLKTSISNDGPNNMGNGIYSSPPLTLYIKSLSRPLTQVNSYSLDHDERTRKRLARSSHKASSSARSFTGLRAKLHAKKRHAEKIQMKKQIKAHEERNVKTSSAPTEPSSTPLPQYLLDRNQRTNDAKALSSQIKNKRAEKAAKFSVPLPKVKGI